MGQNIILVNRCYMGFALYLCIFKKKTFACVGVHLVLSYVLYVVYDVLFVLLCVLWSAIGCKLYM